MKSRRQPRMGRSVSSLALIGGALMLVGASGSLEAQEGRYEQTDIEYGARLFGMHCIACHGENGDLVPRSICAAGDSRALQAIAISATTSRTACPARPWSPTGYKDSEITALVAYVRNIGKVDLGSIKVGDPARGQALFEGKGDCVSCHRVHAEGRASRRT